MYQTSQVKLGRILTAVSEFKRWVGKKRFHNPQTGNKVLFKSLPLDEQRRIYREWSKGQPKEVVRNTKKKPTPKQLRQTLSNHQRWLNGEGGKKATFFRTDLSHRDLHRENLSGVNFGGAKLYKADLSESNLSKSNFTKANLRNAKLQGANLTGAFLFDARLQGANLTGANLSEADLSESHLSESRLDGANLTESFLALANLTNASLTGADLRQADITNANITGADLRGAKFDGFKMPKKFGKKYDTLLQKLIHDFYLVVDK